jgi:hypothetical protein
MRSTSRKWWATVLVAGIVVCAAEARAQTLPALKVSENRRFLITADGRPFFWLGDTAWELFHRATREEAEYYLTNRAAKRFTVIQAVALAEFDGLHAPNAYGDLPLANDDPTRPDERYFAHVDWVIAKANALGLYVGLLPTWGDKWNKKWGVGPEIFTPENAETYGEWLGRRYCAAGIVWILGGDRPIESDAHRAIIRAMARGLRRGDGGAHLMTFHPPGGNSSSTWWHDEPWLDFNMRQNGHGAEFTGRYDQTRVDYDRQPLKPVLDGEPIYEDHPVAFDAKKFGHSTVTDVRRTIYWDLFSGAFGHTYGHHSVWQMWDPQRREPVNNPLLPWREALDQPGAAQLQHARALIESRPFLTRVPAPEMIIEGRVPTSVPGAGRYRFVATRDVDGSYAMVYAPTARPFTVQLGMLRGGPRVRAWWFDPRTGEATEIGVFDGDTQPTFMPPRAGESLDWVLVLDVEAKRYPPPGLAQGPR